MGGEPQEQPEQRGRRWQSQLEVSQQESSVLLLPLQCRAMRVAPSSRHWGSGRALQRIFKTQVR